MSVVLHNLKQNLVYVIQSNDQIKISLTRANPKNGVGGGGGGRGVGGSGGTSYPDLF